jgi:hypothetical protein
MDATPAASADRRELLTVAVVIAAFALAFARLASLVAGTAVNLPFQDQWDLLKPLFNESGPWASFQLQHGPHRQGLGGLIDWALYRATDWDVRAESWAAVVILTLAAFSAVVLARRLRGRLRWTDAVFPLLLMAPVNWETMLLTPNIAHGILPQLLTIWLALAWTIKPAGRRAAVLIVVGFFALFTGFAACAFLVCFALALLRAVRPAADDTGRAGLRWLVIAGLAVAVVLFARGYTFQPAVPNWHFPVANLLDYPRFLALMYASLAGWREISTASIALGGAALAVVLATFIWSLYGVWQGKSAAAAPVLLLTGTALVYGGFTAVGRLPAGIEAAFMWRYLSLLLSAAVGLALALEEWSASAAAPTARVRLGILMFVPALMVWGNFTPDRYAAIVAGGKREWIRVYLATHDITKANTFADFVVYRSDPEAAWLKERLRWLEARKLTFFKAAPDPARVP